MRKSPESEQPREKPNFPEDTPEHRDKITYDTIRFLSASRILETFQDPEAKKELIQNANAETAEAFLERLNGIIIGLPIQNREIYTYSTNVVETETGQFIHFSPHPAWQKAILEDLMLPAIKELDQESGAELSATVVNLLHMFPDGNGRLSRLIYLLLSKKLEGLSEDDCVNLLIQALEKDQGRTEFNPRIIYSILDDRVKDIYMLLDGVVNNDSPALKETDSFGALDVDGIIGIPPAYKYRILNFDRGLIEDKAEAEILQAVRRMTEDPVTMAVAAKSYVLAKSSEEIEKYIVTDPIDGKKHINGEVLIKDFDDREKLRDLVEIYVKVQAWRIKIMVDVYENPDNYESPDPSMNLKDYFRSKVFETVVPPPNYVELLAKYEEGGILPQPTK